MIKKLKTNIFLKLIIILISIGSPACAQNSRIFSTNKTGIVPTPTSVTDESIKRKAPSTVIIWDHNIKKEKNGSYTFSIELPLQFSFFGIGLKSANTPKDYTVRYRTRANNNEWKEWIETTVENSSEENSSEIFWSDILFVNDSIAHNQCEIVIIPTNNETIDFVRIDFVNMKSGNAENQQQKSVQKKIEIQAESCPLPTIITRAEWCGGYADCPTPAYTPTPIEPTHVVIHHGASPDTYTDGYAIVRSYWNYHVYSNGWDDIGYNFLIDKDGNIFQGRANPSIYTQDVKGSHAGSLNSKSIGICFLGNTDVTNATDIQLSALNELLAWWFNWHEFDPTSKESITNQAGTSTLFLPRVIGHRDAKSTSCPGENVYNLLPTIRDEAKKQLISCSGKQPLFDLYLSDATLSTSTIVAGQIVQAELSHKITGSIENTVTKSPKVSIWLSSDTIFNPNQDSLLSEYSDTLIERNTLISSASRSFSVNPDTKPGSYFIFFVSDLKNEFYETNETNNEVCIPTTIIVNQHDIYTSSNSTSGGTTAGQGKFNERKSCTVTATANFGYSFLNWTENDSVVSTNPIYEFVVLSDRNLEANFICNPNTEPVPIEGQTVVCHGENNVIYSVSGTENATSYQWTLPNGAIGTSNTSTIAVDFQNTLTSGIISVKVGNECVLNIESTLAVEVTDAPKAPTVTLLNGVLHSSSPTGNQWYVNNTLIKGAISQELKPNVIGNYFVEISSGNCFSAPSNTIVFNQFTIENSDPIRIYPNPVSENATILLSEYLGGDLKIELYNYWGSIIHTEIKNTATNCYSIDLSEFQRGIYLSKIYVDGKTYMQKILKE